MGKYASAASSLKQAKGLREWRQFDTLCDAPVEQFAQNDNLQMGIDSIEKVCRYAANGLLLPDLKKRYGYSLIARSEKKNHSIIALSSGLQKVLDQINRQEKAAKSVYTNPEVYLAYVEDCLRAASNDSRVVCTSYGKPLHEPLSYMNTWRVAITVSVPRFIRRFYCDVSYLVMASCSGRVCHGYTDFRINLIPKGEEPAPVTQWLYPDGERGAINDILRVADDKTDVITHEVEEGIGIYIDGVTDEIIRKAIDHYSDYIPYVNTDPDYEGLDHLFDLYASLIRFIYGLPFSYANAGLSRPCIILPESQYSGEDRYCDKQAGLAVCRVMAKELGVHKFGDVWYEFENARKGEPQYKV